MTDHLLAQFQNMTIDLPLALERQGTVSLARQLVSQLRAAILSGQLAPGARLPSTRTLSRVLGLSRGAVLNAYDDLLAEGSLVSRPGSGTFVSPDQAASLERPTSAELISAPRWSLVTGSTTCAGNQSRRAEQRH